MVHPASQLLQHYSDRLSRVTFSDEILNRLCIEKVITPETQTLIKDCSGLLVSSSLQALCATVSEDHNKLRIFASVLMKSGMDIALAKELINHYGEYLPQ